MEYHITITGLTDAMKVHQVNEIMEDIKMFLAYEQIQYTDVFIAAQEG